MINCVIFDLDGTILDTLEDIKDSINYSFNKYGYNVNFSKDDIKNFIGNGAKNLIINAGKQACLNEKDFWKVYNCYELVYKSRISLKTKPFDGIIDVFNYLKNKNILLCVLSNKKDVDVKKCVEHYFPNVFDYVSGQKDNVALKPDAEGINIIVKKFNLNLDNILYVGDMDVDELTCKNAGIKFIACSYGYSIKEFNEYYGLIDKPMELIKFL